MPDEPIPSHFGDGHFATCVNRRVSVRYACNDRPWLIRVLAKPSFQSVRALVQDISATGVSLALGSKVPAGTVLAIEFRSSGSGYSGILSARVVRAGPMASGGWLIGCQLSRPLSDEDLRALVQERVRDRVID